MVTFLRGRRSNDGDATIALENATRANAAAALDPLVLRAEAAAEQLRSLASLLDRSSEIDALRERCLAAEEKLASMEQISARFTIVEEKADRIERLGEQMGPLSEKADAALRLHGQLEEFLGTASPVARLREETESLRGQLAELLESVGRMRGQADDALSAHRHATSRLEAFDQDNQAAAGRLEDVVRRVQGVERALEPVNQAVASVPDLQHRLAVLQSLAEQVAQKSGLLEQQREAVERASTQISQLTRLDRELDAWVRRQEEQIRRFGAIEAKLQEVQAIQTKVIARSEELQATSLQNEHIHQAAKQALTDLREQMRKSSEGFELENRGLHAVSERVADLRNAVKECEARFAVLDGSSQGAAAVQAQVRAVGDHSTQLSAELTHLSEQIRVAYEEMSRLREGHAESQSRLAAGAEARLAQLVRKSEEAERVAETMAEVAQSVADVDRRIGAVDSSVRALEGRTGQLDEIEGRIQMLGQEFEQRKGALDKASEHLKQATQLRKQSAEAAHRLEEVSRSVTAALGDAEQRSEKLERMTGELEARASALKAIERPMARFEELLGSWESAQAEASRALEQALARQAAVDALEAQVKHVFELAERAVADVQMIGSARREIEETRELLESTQEQFKATEGALEQFEARKRQLDRAEQRLARAEALALGMRATVEALTAQRTVVDHAMESASGLALQMKQAEALIAAFRKERTIACELKAALALEEDEETDK